MTKVLIKSFKFTKIPPKLKKDQICSKTTKIDQNTPETKKMIKMPPN